MRWGSSPEPFERSWDSKDALLYALGVGAGALDPTGFELEFTTENSDGVTQRVLPSFSAIIGQGGGGRSSATTTPPCWSTGSSPSACTARSLWRGRCRSRRRSWACTTRARPAWSSSRANRGIPASAALAFTNRTALFIRGAGGFGGPRQSGRRRRERVGRRAAADRVNRTRSSPMRHARSGAALPLERGPQPPALGPDLRQAGGFDRPILHGLCTYGFTGRALLHAVCGSDPARFGAMRARFSKPTLPGDTLTVSRCGTSATRARVRTVPHRDPTRRDGHRRWAVLPGRLSRPDQDQPRQSAHTPKISTVCVTSL